MNHYFLELAAYEIYFDSEVPTRLGQKEFLKHELKFHCDCETKKSW